MKAGQAGRQTVKEGGEEARKGAEHGEQAVRVRPFARSCNAVRGRGEHGAQLRRTLTAMGREEEGGREATNSGLLHSTPLSALRAAAAAAAVAEAAAQRAGLSTLSPSRVWGVIHTWVPNGETEHFLSLVLTWRLLILVQFESLHLSFHTVRKCDRVLIQRAVLRTNSVVRRWRARSLTRRTACLFPVAVAWMRLCGCLPRLWPPRMCAKWRKRASSASVRVRPFCSAAPRRPPIFANGDPRVDRPPSPGSRDGRTARYPDFDFLHAASEGGRASGRWRAPPRLRIV